jgi:hypothetical protein
MGKFKNEWMLVSRREIGKINSKIQNEKESFKARNTSYKWSPITLPMTLPTFSPYQSIPGVFVPN